MDDVVERLRASKKRVEEDAFEEGKTSGRDWAEASAEFDELERVVKGDLGGNDDQLASLKRLIDPTDEADAYFWEKFLPQGHEQESAGNNAFAQGFVAGAIAVYREVIGRL